MTKHLGCQRSHCCLIFQNAGKVSRGLKGQLRSLQVVDFAPEFFINIKKSPDLQGNLSQVQSITAFYSLFHKVVQLLLHRPLGLIEQDLKHSERRGKKRMRTRRKFGSRGKTCIYVAPESDGWMADTFRCGRI